MSETKVIEIYEFKYRKDNKDPWAQHDRSMFYAPRNKRKPNQMLLSYDVVNVQKIECQKGALRFNGRDHVQEWIDPRFNKPVFFLDFY